jgi:hypothetical protein
MLESGSSGSVRGVPSNGHPYRDPPSFLRGNPNKHNCFTLDLPNIWRGINCNRDWGDYIDLN